MPRRPRVFVEGLTYHVYNRVGRGEAPFRQAREAEAFLGLLREDAVFAARLDELDAALARKGAHAR